MSFTITQKDPRYLTSRRGKNARWPANASDAVASIEVCVSATDVAETLQRIIHAGVRPTVRASGHCYEDFVANNPKGAIIDVSQLNHTTAATDGTKAYEIGAGAALGAIYAELYKKYNVTIPGGSCYSVAAGGHISGGGYGLLARLHGVTADWLSAVDICTVEANGKVRNRHVHAGQDADLFRACRGAGGASFGIITKFYFDSLPAAPRTLTSAGVSFPWDTMTEEKFIKIVQTYGEYFETRGKDKATWGMFTFMGLVHKSGGSIGISASFHDGDDGSNTTIIGEFLDRFVKCEGAQSVTDVPLAAHRQDNNNRQQLPPCTAGKHTFRTRPWIDATLSDSGSAGGNGSTRAKYKSCYMRKNFTTEEVRRLYKHLTREVPGLDMRGLICAVDSYGGATNKAHLAEETSLPQRDSIMKLQYQSYWTDAADDEGRVKFLDEMYADVYSANVDAKHAGTPYPNEHYEGCYINYPDVDMMRYPFWSDLYYGKDGLYPFLQTVKKKYDPNNIFHNSMSIRPK